jgi:molybdate transport system regulatory protein
VVTSKLRADQKTARADRKLAPSLQVRVQLKNGRELGPSKAELLDAIAVHGSITSASRAIGVSYKYAWRVVDDLNASFATPLVLKLTGGVHGGSAVLTKTGLAVLATFRSIETQASRCAVTDLLRLNELASILESDELPDK